MNRMQAGGLGVERPIKRGTDGSYRTHRGKETAGGHCRHFGGRLAVVDLVHMESRGSPGRARLVVYQSGT